MQEDLKWSVSEAIIKPFGMNQPADNWLNYGNFN